ncbi:MAG: PaaI family thioesterase [Clostridiales bacterium]|nr:PaaI family thioesterase [Clostridiales bacterium]
MKVIRVQNNSKNCMICGMENPFSLKAPFYILDDGSVASIVTFKSIHQSYPDRTHGGMVSALLDELMGRALWVVEPEMFGVTTTLNITYRKPTPLDTPVKARAYLTFNSSRGMVAKGQVFDMVGNLLVEGSAKYFKIPFNRLFGENTTQHEEMCYEMPLDIKEIDFPKIEK